MLSVGTLFVASIAIVLLALLAPLVIAYRALDDAIGGVSDVAARLRGSVRADRR